jgi:hypothetical protein
MRASVASNVPAPPRGVHDRALTRLFLALCLVFPLVASGQSRRSYSKELGKPFVKIN